MIDWMYVGWNSLWIVGLSIALSVISIAIFQSSEHKQELGQILRGKSFSIFINLGMALFSLGWTGLAGAWWGRVLWGLLCVGFIFNLWMDSRRKTSI